MLMGNLVSVSTGQLWTEIASCAPRHPLSGSFRSGERRRGRSRRKRKVRHQQPITERQAPRALRPDKIVRPPRPAQLRQQPTSRLSSSPWHLHATEFKFTASAEFHDKLQRLAALMPGADLASMMEAAVTEKLERLEAKRLGKVKNPRKGLEETDTSPGVRGIPAPVRRFVWDRDQGQCTFEAADGRRCPERHGLQFHHDDPYGRGGDRSANNIRLLCRVHNLYMAEMDYGKDKMKRYWRSADRVREPSPSFPLCPDGVQESPPLRVAIAMRFEAKDGVVPRIGA